MARSPDGRRKDKIITDALRITLMDAATEDGKAKVRLLAEKMVELAVSGNVEAAKFVADRIEGKAHATVDMRHDVSETFLRLLEHVDTSVAAGVAREPGQPAPIRH